VLRLEITLLAEVDLAEIFNTSAEDFGPLARRRYEDLVGAAFADLLADPLRLGSLDRPELRPNLRTYHLRYSRARSRAKGRVAKPRHLIAYKVDETRVLILRVLHDAMDLGRHFG
jgi:toxin ParE1/3/4